MAFPYRSSMDWDEMRWDRMTEMEQRQAMRARLLKQCGLSSSCPDVEGMAIHRGTLRAEEVSKKLWQWAAKSGLVLVFDWHGTIVERNKRVNRLLVDEFNKFICIPARAHGIPLVVVTAAPTREFDAWGAVFDLSGWAFACELGLINTTAFGQTPFSLADVVTPDIIRALANIRVSLELEAVKPVFIEAKRLLASLNVGMTNNPEEEKQRWGEIITTWIEKEKVSLVPYFSDHTIDTAPFGKGMAVLRTVDGLRPNGKRQLAVFGDGPADIDMMKVASPGLIGAPANADPLVKHFVNEHGGYLAQRLPCTAAVPCGNHRGCARDSREGSPILHLIHNAPV